MNDNPESELLLERVDDLTVQIEHLQEKLAQERILCDRLAAALYSRGFTGNQIDALGAYEMVHHA